MRLGESGIAANFYRRATEDEHERRPRTVSKTMGDGFRPGLIQAAASGAAP
jgi:hypothetical protein